VLVQPIPSDAALKEPDFSHVEFRHERIHERLINWAKWVRPGFGAMTHPMWRGFKSSDVFSGVESAIPIDELDAHTVEKGVSALPEKHRFAVRWCYVFRTQPFKAARLVGESQQGLADLIVAGRVMLINRRV
jgi:hypothetical protein